MELFVTDLDGTLLNSHKEVSIKSIEILNKLIRQEHLQQLWIYYKM